MNEKQPPNRLSMEIDPSAIDAIVRQTVGASIAAALQKQGIDFAGAVTQAILDARVDSDGKILHRGHWEHDRSKISWFDFELNKCLRECAKKAMSEFVAAQAPKIEKAMMAAFQKRTPEIVKVMTDGTMKAFTEKWGFRFDVNITRQES